jgi:hypothetical protein
LINPWAKKGLLNARVLDLAMMVLSRSKKAAVRGLGLAGIDDVCWSAAESDTVTGPA